MSRLDEIRQRLAAATPGPWVSPWDQDQEQMQTAIRAVSGEPVCGITWFDGPQFMVTAADAALIANAPADLAYLLGEVEKLHKGIDRLYELACGGLKGEEGLRVAKAIACVANELTGARCLQCEEAKAQEHSG